MLSSIAKRPGSRGTACGGGRRLLSANLRVPESKSLKCLLEQVKSLLDLVACRILPTHPSL